MERKDLSAAAQPVAARAAALGLYMAHYNSGARRNELNGFRLFRKAGSEFFAGNHIAHLNRLADVEIWLDGYCA